MTQSGISDEFLVVVWFGKILLFQFFGAKHNKDSFAFQGNNDSWLELYKLCKEQWKSEIAAHEQV